MIQAKFGLNWPSGFRGEYFWKSLQTDDRCQVMAIAHTGIWVDILLNIYFFYKNLHHVIIIKTKILLP
jgi:hypothetical protein